MVLEDVDLIAEERTRQEPGCTTLLFELLNEMDGLADDVDVVFVLTTNRPDLLEPALAARPGRVDLVVEVPLPDAACRRRLIELYGRGITLRVNDMDDLVEGLEGASPAFIRELLRKAALLAVGSGREIVVEDGHLANALRDLVTDSGILGRRLLGMSGRAAGGAPAPAPRRPSAPEVDQMAWSPLALTVGSLDAAAGSTCPAPHFRIVTELPACLRQQAERSRPERGT